MQNGEELLGFAKDLWPINRSLTGAGVRQTFDRIKEHLPALKVHEIPSGTKAFDWEVPKEWRIQDAWIKTPQGNKICDFQQHNLHLVGYSTPFHGKVNLNQLQNHLYSLPEQPKAIPYVTSYYKERWGFCI